MSDSIEAPAAERPLVCDFCTMALPVVIPGGTVLCPCGAVCLVVRDKLHSCRRSAVPIHGAVARPRRERPAERSVARQVRRQPLAPKVVAACSDLMAQGARVADLAHVLQVPVYVVQRATAGTVSPGRKPARRVTLREVEHALYPVLAAPDAHAASPGDPEPAQVDLGALDGPAGEVSPEVHQAIVETWRAMTRKLARSSEGLRHCALNATASVLSIAAVRQALAEEARAMLTAGRAPDHVAAELHATPGEVARLVVG